MQSIEPRLKSHPIKTKKTSYPLLVGVLLLFAFGFIPQILGVLSLTATNMLALLAFSIFNIKRGLFNGRIHTLTILYLALSTYLLVSGLINGSSVTSILVYIYYLLATYIAIATAQTAVRSGYINEEKILKILPRFLCVQILVCIVQNAFATQISQFSKTPVIPLDIASGTFYLTSDASLGFFCLISSIFTFSTNQATRTKYLILSLTTIIVLLTSSKASQLSLAITLLLLLSYDIVSKVKAHKKIIVAVSPIVLLGISVFFFESFDWVQNLVNGTLIEAYDKRFSGPEAHRLAPIGELLYGKFVFFGHGLLAYYNPIDKVWLYNSGSSLFYTIFIDCGLLATVLIYSFFLYIIMQNEKRLIFRILYSSVFFPFTFFNFALTDIASILVFFALLNIQKNKSRNESA